MTSGRRFRGGEWPYAFHTHAPYDVVWVEETAMTEPQPMPKRKKYSAPALEKGLDVLELLVGEPKGLNTSELAKRLGRSVGEVFRMIAVLEQRGYIHPRGSGDAHVLTLKLFELAHRIPPIALLVNAAAAELSRLSHAIGQSSHLVIYFDGRGHVVVQQDPPSERVLSVRLGAEAPLVDTCSGHVLLAFASDRERATMVREIPQRNRKPGKGELCDLVARIRSQGHEMTPSRQVHGVQDIGYPVFDHTGEVAAALVVPFLAYLDDSHPIPLAEAILEAGRSARTISSALGYREKDAPLAVEAPAS